MFATLQGLFDSGRLPADNLKNAVTKGWITANQYQQITGEAYAA